MSQPDPKYSKYSLDWSDKNLIDLEDSNYIANVARVKPHAVIRDSRITRKEKKEWKRNIPVDPQQLHGHFINNAHNSLASGADAVKEASRCLKCADAPCQKSCPTTLDIKQFIGAIATGNFYGSAKQILSDNPVGESCGLVCPVSELCEGSCNIYDDPIRIGALQAFAVDTFRRMGLPQIRDPSATPIDQLPESFSTPIALIGCGPASISCATFLARLGYSKVTIFEKNQFPGGLSTLEIPQTRLPYSAVDFEVKLMLDLGVKIEYGVEFGRDITISSLRERGFRAIFLGFGLPDPQKSKIFEGLDDKSGFYTSKSFLPLVTSVSKSGLCGCKSSSLDQLPKLYGKVVILGAGDTAMDCATSAIRCGASKVTLVFRKGFSGIRAVPEEYEIALHEKTDVMPNCLPKKIITRDGRITAIELYKTEVNEKGETVIDDDQFVRLKCDFVVTAFGSTVTNANIIQAAAPVKFTDWGRIKVDQEMCVQDPQVEGVFAGGDLIGSGMTVEGANDGKTASWSIHKYIQQDLFKAEVPKTPALPKFYTPIDEIDLSIEVAGIKFPNPFGLASAPPATTAAMIARGFEAGWGFAVTKTYGMDESIVTNVAPRIVNGSTAGQHKQIGPHQSSYLNIELISEKSASYWCNAVRQLRQRFPDKVVIASIMAIFRKEDWQTLALRSAAAGANAIELNLSCPHGMGERGMGMACGQDPNLVRNICKWVKEAVPDVPVFAKLTPNVTDIVEIARAAKEGGADGVTAINTVSGLMQLNTKGEAWPRIGAKKRTTYGGMSGNAVRGLALRAVSAIAKALPGFPILATGGADGADTTLQFIHAGASAVQMSSVIQNQDFSIIEDFITGLKTILFMNAHGEYYKDWDGQYLTHKVLQPERLPGKGLPKFGQHLKKRRQAEVDEIKSKGLLTETKSDQFEIPRVDLSVRVSTLQENIGLALDRVTAWHQLDPKAEEHVVAVINDELCVNCGRCFLSCSDTGYQAISFDLETHLPAVNTDNCTGCNLCSTACPVAECITMVPRTELNLPPYKPKRGLPLGEFGEPIKIDV